MWGTNLLAPIWLPREDGLGGVYNDDGNDSISIVTNDFEAILRLWPSELPHDEVFKIQRPLWEGWDLYYTVIVSSPPDAVIRIKVSDGKAGMFIHRFDGKTIKYAVFVDFRNLHELCKHLFTGY